MTWDITKQVLASIIRAVLFGAGAWLVNKGIIDQPTAEAWLNEMTATILGLIIIAIPIVWKVLNARFNILALIKAVQTDPPADTPREVTAAVEAVKADVKAENTVTTV